MTIVEFQRVPCAERLIRDRRPVSGTVVNHTAPCATIADFRETTNVGTYKGLISAESLNSC